MGSARRDVRSPSGEGPPRRSLGTPGTDRLGDGGRRQAPRHGGHRRRGRVPGPPAPRRGLLRAAVAGRGRRCVAHRLACPPSGAGTRPFLSSPHAFSRFFKPGARRLRQLFAVRVRSAGESRRRARGRVAHGLGPQGRQRLATHADSVLGEPLGHLFLPDRLWSNTDVPPDDAS